MIPPYHANNLFLSKILIPQTFEKNASLKTTLEYTIGDSCARRLNGEQLKRGSELISFQEEVFRVFRLQFGNMTAKETLVSVTS